MSTRLALVALVWLVIIGGTALLQQKETPKSSTEAPTEISVQGDYSLELTPTFKTEKDPFALQDDDSQPSAVTVAVSGKQFFASDALDADVPVRITLPEGLVAGVNEILVKASPPLYEEGSQPQSNAVRLQLLRGEIPIAQDTFWAEAGQNVVGTLRVTIETPHGGEE